MGNEALKQMNLFARMRWGIENLPNQQKKVCSHIIENYQQVAFMTVEELSKSSGASPSTVVRTILNLGYPTFHEMLQEIQEMLILNKSSLWWQLEESWQRPSKGEGGNDEQTLPRVFRDNIDSLRNSLTIPLMDSFGKSVDLLCRAERIAILGTRSSHGAAHYFFSLLHQFLPNVLLADRAGSDDMFADLIDLTPDDCLLALSLGGPHYAARTIDGVRFLHAREVPVVLLTTDLSCPVVPEASVVMCVSPARQHYSQAPVIAVLEALVVELGKRKKAQATKKLRSLEKILSEYRVTL
jgi:DNA-binding MurR/RpiR family transcriptional regulator